MKQTGKIIIKDDQVIFEYEDKELKCLNGISGEVDYFAPVKRSVEVSNHKIEKINIAVMEGHPCEAEVTKDIAIITKIL